MTRKQFTELVVAEQEALRRFLLTLCCGNRDDADDLAQEALVKAYLASGNLRDESKLKAWLYKIAYNTFISSRRSTQTFTSIDETADIAASLSGSYLSARLRRPSTEPSQCLDIADDSLAPDRKYKYQELYAALAQMQPKERTALVLFYMNDYSVKEISTIVDWSEAAVRQQLSRGRDHLRERLGVRN